MHTRDVVKRQNNKHLLSGVHWETSIDLRYRWYSMCIQRNSLVSNFIKPFF